MMMSFGHLIPAGLPVISVIALDTARAATNVIMEALFGSISGFNTSVIQIPCPAGESNPLPRRPFPASCLSAMT